MEVGGSCNLVTTDKGLLCSKRMLFMDTKMSCIIFMRCYFNLFVYCEAGSHSVAHIGQGLGSGDMAHS